MKWLYLILLTPFLFSSCAQDFEKIPSAEVDQSKVEIAKKLSDNILKAQKAGSYYDLSGEEAEARMIGGFSEKVQRDAYEQISGAYGHYRGLEFVEMAKPTDGTLYEMYRFKGQFESKALEIRCVLNANSKLSGFWIKPWRDQIR